ncbi:MAG: hypothetical protein LCH99_08420 [Proteobacteria bacterium]|nr:hypothetical protein [Pseudomonadota bacterium]
MIYRIWGYDFDELPLGYISALTTELVVQEVIEGRVQNLTKWNGSVTFMLPVWDHFLAVSHITLRDKNGLAGRVNIFSLAGLAPCNDDTVFDAYRPSACVEFTLENYQNYSPEDLLMNSDASFCETAAAKLIVALIAATNADGRDQSRP